MASTEVVLGERHLAGCLALSKSAHWNQNEADWRLMLGFGRGWGIVEEDGTLAASTLALPYGGAFAWIAMVLVLPEHRRKGFATRLLKIALGENARSGRVSVLDATPDGREVYRQEGFRDAWGFKRYSIPGAPRANVGATALDSSHWPEVLALDAMAFGASREPVLRDLASRQPGLARVAIRRGQVAGFVLGREGREALQIGPLVAKDAEVARELLETALGGTTGPVYLDIADHAAPLQAWVLARGFAIQRPFTRMVHGASGRAPGEAPLVYCPAGPELG
ncbi:MAG: GNAT family N-acetyltransferase [Burkholderiales bacterium]|nr:GNAT family N-acetyltransferase [Burkholderiales bacterium]